jgi:SSS family transporter
MKPIDLAVVFIYLIATTLLGLYFSKKQKTTKDYFLGGKELPWWAILVSIIAQETSAVTILSVPAITFGLKGNYTFLQLALGYITGRCLIAAIFIPRIYGRESYSIYGYLTERFGVATKNVAVITFMVSRVLAIGIRIYVGAIVIMVVTGLPSWFCIVLTTLLSILYMTFGGFKAVIWTDVLQFVVYMAGAVGAYVVILNSLQNPSILFQQAWEAGKFRMWDTALTLTTAYNFWAGLIGGAFLTMGTHGTDQSIAQRLMAARTEKDSRKIIIGSGLAIFFQFAFYLTLGILLYFFYNQLHPDLAAQFAKNEEAFPRFALTFLPWGLGGMVVAGVFAAAMSSNDFNPLSNALIFDLYKPYFKPNAPDAHYLKMGRWFTAFWGLLTMGVAILSSQSQQTLIDLALKIPSYTYGPLLGIFLLGFLTRNIRQKAVVWGAVAGFAMVLLVVPPWPESWMAFKGLFPKLAWPWLTPLGCLTTVIVAYLVNLTETVKK